MFSSHSYILVLDTEPRGLSEVHLLESQLQYPVFIANSTEQAVAWALQVPPSLVILVGDRVQDWSTSLVAQLRQNVQAANLTIVALTNSGSPQWNYVEETPGGLDGFLVKPLSIDILRSLLESAFARRTH